MTRGRLLLALVTASGMLVSVAVLLWLGRSGGIRPETLNEALGRLLTFYLPAFSVMAGCFFARSGAMGGEEPRKGTLLFALLIAGAWAIWPLVGLLVSDTIQDALALIETVRLRCDSLALGAVCYYFANR